MEIMRFFMNGLPPMNYFFAPLTAAFNVAPALNAGTLDAFEFSHSTQLCAKAKPMELPIDPRQKTVLGCRHATQYRWQNVFRLEFAVFLGHGNHRE